MKKFLLIFAGFSSHVMRAGAVAITLYVLAKCVSALFNSFNRYAYAAE